MVYQHYYLFLLEKYCIILRFRKQENQYFWKGKTDEKRGNRVLAGTFQNGKSEGANWAGL